MPMRDKTPPSNWFMDTLNKILGADLAQEPPEMAPFVEALVQPDGFARVCDVDGMARKYRGTPGKILRIPRSDLE